MVLFMNKGFTIICENCGHTYRVGIDDYFKDGMVFIVERHYDEDYIEIGCKKCNNEQKIE